MSSNYTEIIQFNNQVGGIKVRQKGVKVSDDLCVAWASPYSSEERYRIFSITSGRPVVNFDFRTFNDAKEYAERLDKIYHEFWFLLSEYPKMSIPQICMWTVPDGIRIWDTIKTLETNVRLTPDGVRDTITLTDLARAYEASKDKVAEYMKFPQKG